MSQAITAILSAAGLHATDMKADGLQKDTVKQTITVGDEQVTVLVQVWRLKPPKKRCRAGETRKRV